MASCNARREPLSASVRPVGGLVNARDVKHAHPLASVVRDSGVALIRRGRVLLGCCPFHADTQPSMLVDERDDHFHCFSCRAHGDVLDFVQRIHRIDFREAVAQLARTPAAARHVRVVPADPTCPRANDRTCSPAARACLAAAAALYHDQLWSAPGALAYLRGRGLQDETLRRWRVGYAAGDTLVAFLRWRRIPLAAARQAGLLSKGDREHLAGRIVVPELRGGQPIWMIGRVNPPTDMGPKYLGLPGPKPLFGWEAAHGVPIVYVVEGVFDALVLSQWGYSTVALLGTHAGPAALGDLARFARLYVVLDNDDAGRAATTALVRSLGSRAVPVTLTAVTDVADLALLLDGRERFVAAACSALSPIAA